MSGGQPILVPYGTSSRGSSLASDDDDTNWLLPSAQPPPALPSHLRWPERWSMGESQATGSYPVAKHQFALRGIEWDSVRVAAWEPLRAVLEAQDHDAVKQLSGASLMNVEETARLFYGFLVKVKGMAPRQACRPYHITDAWLLNHFWRFLATPKLLLGRGMARSTMRLHCNGISHLLVACEAARLPSCKRPPLDVKTWWEDKAHPSLWEAVAGIGCAES
eukprot:jgi/Tetstr1/463258/TSEL_000715.t1